MFTTCERPVKSLPNPGSAMLGTLCLYWSKK